MRKVKDFWDRLRLKGKYSTILNLYLVIGSLLALMGGFYFIYKGSDGLLGLMIVLLGGFISFITLLFWILSIAALDEVVVEKVDIPGSINKLISESREVQLSKNEVKMLLKIKRKLS